MSTIERVAREPVIRGCGSRKAGGVYLCTGLAEHGLPIESFFIDPVKAMAVECFRAPTLIDDPFVEGLKHIAVWIGAEHYPSPADYLDYLPGAVIPYGHVFLYASKNPIYMLACSPEPL